MGQVSRQRGEGTQAGQEEEKSQCGGEGEAGGDCKGEMGQGEGGGEEGVVRGLS